MRIKHHYQDYSKNYERQPTLYFGNQGNIATTIHILGPLIISALHC